LRRKRSTEKGLSLSPIRTLKRARGTPPRAQATPAAFTPALFVLSLSPSPYLGLVEVPGKIVGDRRGAAHGLGGGEGGAQGGQGGQGGVRVVGLVGQVGGVELCVGTWRKKVRKWPPLARAHPPARHLSFFFSLS